MIYTIDKQLILESIFEERDRFAGPLSKASVGSVDARQATANRIKDSRAEATKYTNHMVPGDTHTMHNDKMQKHATFYKEFAKNISSSDNQIPHMKDILHKNPQAAKKLYDRLVTPPPANKTDYMDFMDEPKTKSKPPINNIHMDHIDPGIKRYA